VEVGNCSSRESIAPGRIAGTISVSYVQDGSPGATRVTPRYDVTSLSPEGVAFVKELEAKDTAFSEEWRAEILAGLASEQEGEAPAE
jgi:hypothetical protein